MVKRVLEYAQKEQSEVLVISAKVEEEIAQLDEKEKMAFLKELGINESEPTDWLSAVTACLG